MPRRTFIIAEAGVNHGGDYAQALQLVRAAKNAGTDAVKFQHFSAAALGRPALAPLELSDVQMREIAAFAGALGIEFMATPFGAREVGVLVPLVKRLKVASGCLERWGLLHAIRDTRLPVIMSTGMADMARINKALGALGYYFPAEYKQPYTLLHCVSAYPCRTEDANLAAMDVLRHQHGERCAIGYSDHTQGITVALAAAARSAAVIEKHLTLDRNAAGPDHRTSLEPKEFRVMVEAIRMIEAAIGEWGEKSPRECEAETVKIWYGDQR